MTCNLKIDELKPGEVKEFRELVSKVFNHYDRTYVIKALGHVKTFIAKCGKEIVGFIETYITRIDNEKAGIIYYIGVHPDHQGKGVGKTLVNYALNYFSNRSVKVVLASTRSWNLKARKFFRKLGFEEYTYEELIEKKGYEYLYKLVKALYAYEDDIFLIKKN